MSYNPYNQGPAAESGHGYGQPEQHEMQPYGQPYGSPQQQYGSPQPQHSQYSTPNPQRSQYASPNPQHSQYATPNPQQSPYGSPHPQQSQYGSPQPHQGGANVLSQTEFLQRVSAIRRDIDSLETSIRNIATLHQQTLASSDNAARGQLDDLVGATQLKNTAIRGQLHSLKADTERTQDGSFNLKKRQFESLNEDFKKKIQGFLEDEKAYKERYREQLARQYRIVNPDATEDEVQQATSENAEASEGIFAQALRTNRVGQASAVLGNVRARHNDMLKIEQSILQLLDLLNILNEQIVMQGAVIQQIDDEAGKTTDHLRDANVQIEKGVEHARRARKLKWWCLLVVVLICAIIALVLGIYFGVVNKKN